MAVIPGEGVGVVMIDGRVGEHRKQKMSSSEHFNARVAEVADKKCSKGSARGKGRPSATPFSFFLYHLSFMIQDARIFHLFLLYFSAFILEDVLEKTM